MGAGGGRIPRRDPLVYPRALPVHQVASQRSALLPVHRLEIGSQSSARNCFGDIC